MVGAAPSEPVCNRVHDTRRWCGESKRDLMCHGEQLILVARSERSADRKAASACTEHGLLCACWGIRTPRQGNGGCGGAERRERRAGGLDGRGGSGHATRYSGEAIEKRSRSDAAALSRASVTPYTEAT